MPEVKKLRLLNLAFINKIKKKRKQRFKQIVILWKDDQNGQKRYVTEVVAEAVHFIESRAIREQRGNAPVQNDYTQNNYQSAPVNNEATPYDFGNSQTTNVVDDPFKDFGDEIKIGDNELPF